MSAKSEKFNFVNASGETLSGRLELPMSKPKAFAIFAHCFTCSKNLLAASRISKRLTDSNIAVLRFDFTGLGNSEGDFSNTNFSSNIEDIYSAYTALTEKYQAPELLIGHSLGGTAVLQACKKLDKVKAVVSIAAPSDTLHVSDNFKTQISEIKDQGVAQVNLSGRIFNIKKQFLDDISSQKVLDGLSEQRKAFLILHSPTDNTVSIDHAAKIYQTLKHPKSFVSLDTADHLLMDKDDAEYAAQIIGSWISRYLKEVESEKIKPSTGELLVVGRPKHNFTQDIYSMTNKLVADEPKSFKGDDLGMNPYELLQAALGACTSMTMKMYADRKKWNLKDVVVELKHSKVYGEDCEDCEESKSKLDHITKKITVSGDLTPEQIDKLIAIAEKCPINKTLNSDIKIESI
ncbi:osmotically inducible protein C [Halobacteriovorax marinus]|uniref:Osmotically inducible protein C n=1 Tax=Halobacteriovorax marinus TaxID=97084 RepID=A0A1Y5F987_9BACT|nr:osmotically inducible protein C [Halobacteriovorax marinus]